MDADLYVPGDGWLHRTDPRVKFLISIVMLALCLVWRNWAFILGILILEHVMLATDRVPAERIGWVWKILAVLIVFIVVLWPVFDQSGTHVLWQWGWLRLTQENLLMAAVMGLRIPALGFACFITLFTTSQTKLVRGLTSLGVPYKAGLTLATALRYIPVFFSIFQSVSEAQRARGLDLSGKVNAAGKKRNIFVRLVDRFKSYLPIIIAVLIRAYKMSQSVGWAMESRGLNLNRNGVKRTYRVNLTMSIADWIILVIAIAAAAGSVWLMTWLSYGGVMTQDEERTTITARDLKVVSALQCNGRMTMQALADKIGISVYAATESYKRLTEAGIMTIVPVCNPLSLGNYSQVLVGLRINGNRNEALAMLKAMPQVTYVVCALGDADIIAEAVVYSSEGMDHFLKYDLRALPGLTRLQVFSCGRLVLDDHNVSVVNRLLAERGETGFMTKREASVGTDIPVHRLDSRFVHTFNELQKDGRASYATLGEHLGVTHTAIRGRVKKLEDSGVMRIMATVSPMRLGGFRQAFLGIGVKPPYRLDAEQLLEIDEVTYAMSGVGLNGADYLIEIIAGDDEDLWRVVDESIRSLPGVDQTWWASTVSVEKESYWLEPPQDGVLLDD